MDTTGVNRRLLLCLGIAAVALWTVPVLSEPLPGEKRPIPSGGQDKQSGVEPATRRQGTAMPVGGGAQKGQSSATVDNRQGVWIAIAMGGSLAAFAAVVVSFIHFNRKFKALERRLRAQVSRGASIPAPDPSWGQQTENNKLSRRLDELERSLHSLREQMFLPKLAPDLSEVPSPRPPDLSAATVPNRASEMAPMPDDGNFNREYLYFYNELLKRSGSKALIELRRSWKDMAQMSLDRESFLAREGTFLTSDKGIFYVIERNDGLFDIYLDPTANPGKDIVAAVFEVQGNGAQIAEMNFPAIFEQDQSSQRLKLVCKGEISAPP